ncbi:MAG: DegT/DnrJ/EryC1/StrS family aminotransferase [Alphaproteobacteria bacterium]|nr:DegT/DnrJ/EryC1/StrS family aminotransferase [Alphaproteobacteria bacterium]
MASSPIHVTRPFLPPLEEVVEDLRTIWDSRILTNNGPFHRRFEAALAEYLQVKHVVLFNNATIALIVALKALEIGGEVITTPYSFVATAHSLSWNAISPVFCDIDARSLSLDPQAIRAAITPKTQAILPVHCYGLPSAVAEIAQIASEHRLRVIYDAAHAFGIRNQQGSLLAHGDLSILSFHATKVFNSFEGGAIICHDDQLKHRIEQQRNFGFVDEVTVDEVGINGKMSEFNAALGLIQLRHFPTAIAQRQRIDRRYREQLAQIRGIQLVELPQDYTSNHGYFPILVGPDYGLSRDQLYQRLKDNDIHPRRYFYPLISEFPAYRRLVSSRPINLPVATRVAQQVLCLPIYPGLSEPDQERIIAIIKKA